MGVQETRRNDGGVQVMVEHALHRGMLVGFALAGYSFLYGVGAQ
jgi:hypothetical protein